MRHSPNRAIRCIALESKDEDWQYPQERLTNDSTVGPAVLLAAGNAWYLWKAHWEHWEHMPPLEERVEYPYQNIRTKNYQWGNGDKVSSLHATCVETS